MGARQPQAKPLFSDKFDLLRLLEDALAALCSTRTAWDRMHSTAGTVTCFDCESVNPFSKWRWTACHRMRQSFHVVWFQGWEYGCTLSACQCPTVRHTSDEKPCVLESPCKSSPSGGDGKARYEVTVCLAAGFFRGCCTTFGRRPVDTR
jgi:hypothetical protein